MNYQTIFIILGAILALVAAIYLIPKEYRTYQAHKKELADSFNNLMASFDNIPADEKKKLLGDGLNFLRSQFPIQKVFTCGNCVVTYEPRALHYKKESVEEKLAAILKAHPDADLTKHENALGVKIIDVQRPSDKKEKRERKEPEMHI